jgi:hypothetical protein
MTLPPRALALALSLAAIAPACADPAAAPAPAFAIFPPAAVARLAGEATTPEALATIKQAEADFAATPGPLPRVHTEGTLPHQGIWDQSLAAEKDWPRMLDLATAYALTGDSRYLAATEKFLNAWLDVYHPSFNPIDETNLDRMIFAYDLTRARLTSSTRDKMSTFLRAMASGYLDRIAAEKKEDNANWQSHRIKLIVLAAYGLGDADLITRARQAYWRQVSVNIRPDGSVDDFYKRDALHYVTYDLEPLVTAALAAKEHGEDWFHVAPPGSTGAASVASAVDWLTPYALGQQTHQEFVHSTVKFDAQRAQAGVKGFSGPWAPHGSILLYELAGMIDPKYETTLQQVLANIHEHRWPWYVLMSGAMNGA